MMGEGVEEGRWAEKIEDSRWAEKMKFDVRKEEKGW